MNNYARYITPEEAKELGDTRSLKELVHLSKKKPKKCFVCGCEDEWLYGGCGMCFTCTTGEADASDDFELQAP